MIQTNIHLRTIAPTLGLPKNGVTGRAVVLLLTFMYFAGVIFLELNNFVVFFDSTQYLPGFRLDFGYRPALFVPVLASLLVCIGFGRLGKVKGVANPATLALWVAIGIMLSIWVASRWSFVGNASLVWFGIVFANALCFSFLICELRCELMISKRVSQYARWFAVLLVYYFSIWIPPIFSIETVRWFAIAATGVMYASKAGRSFLKQHEDMRYLVLMTATHAVLMLLSRKDVLF